MCLRLRTRMFIFAIIVIVFLAYLAQNGSFPLSLDVGIGRVITSTKPGETQKGIKLLIFARKRTGSSMVGKLFAQNPETFYFYEPDRIIASRIFDIGIERWERLEDIRFHLMNFLDAIYSCNFTDYEYLVPELNDVDLYGMRGGYGGNYTTSGNITVESMTEQCSGKKNIVTKVLRLYNAFLAAPLLIKHGIKVIHLIRDPRGMMKSREMFRERTNEQAIPGEMQLEERMKTEIKDYCRWFETNYLVFRHAPEWFRDNYLLIRYEDIVQHPRTAVRKMYEFVGLPTDDTMKAAMRDILGVKPGNSQAWRNGVTYENAKEMQELCPTRVWKMFGYKLVESPEMLKDNTTSLVVNMDLDSYLDYNK